MKMRILFSTPSAVMAAVLVAWPQTPADPRAQFERLRQMVERGDFAHATPELQQLLQAAPNSALLHNLLGYCRLRQGDREKAIPEFQRAIALNPDFKPAHGNLGGVYLLQGKIEDAATEFAAVLRIDPHDSNVSATVLKMGQATFRKQDYPATVRLLGLIPPAAERTAEWHEMIGYSSFKCGDIARAVAEIQKAMDLDPRNEDYVLELSEVFVDNNNGAAAVTLLDAARTLFPASARLWLALGVAYLVDENWPLSEAALRKCVEVDPSLDLAFVVLGQGYKEAGQWSDLLATGDRLIAVNSHNPTGYYYKALALLRSPTPDEAQIESLLRQSVALGAREPGPHYELAKILAGKGEKSEALRELETLVMNSADFGPAYYQLYRLYREEGNAGKSKEAQQAYQRIQAREREQVARKLLLDVRQRGGGS
jgi:tetratricopeptide (TPR) repeat protein